MQTQVSLASRLLLGLLLGYGSRSGVVRRGQLLHDRNLPMTEKEISNVLVDAFKLLLSWPVVALIIVVALRAQLEELLKSVGSKLTKAKFGSVDLEFAAPKTTVTSLGKTNVSAIPTKFDTDSLAFRSRRFGFEISYPSGPGWDANLDPDGKFGAQPGDITALYILSTLEIDGFHPNVNVLVQPVGDVSITQYMGVSIKSLAGLHWRLIAYDVDVETNGASFSYLLDLGELRYHCVARVLIARGLAFLATITTREGSKIPTEQRAQLSSILNSFSLLENNQTTVIAGDAQETQASQMPRHKCSAA